MKHLLTLSLFLGLLQNALAQLPNPVPANGASLGQVIRVVSDMGVGFGTAKAEQERNREQEEQLEQYGSIVVQADTLFNRKDYPAAIRRYNDALRIKQEQYPKDQIAKANVQIARAQREEYQLIVDRADSLYNRLEYAAAIESYRAALAKRNEPYPNDRIKAATAELARWKTVHFSGQFISDMRVDNVSARAYADDPSSDFLKPGKYAWLESYLVYSGFQSLDGIAVPAGMRLVVYSGRSMQGTVLLDITGPAIVNNGARKTQAQAAGVDSKTFLPGLQEAFPQQVRTWSSSDMQTWISGSLEIIAL